MATEACAPAPAKITAPVPAEIVERPRLYRALDAALERRITWISGPGGCGKTTLIASYLRTRGCSCIWYQGDPSDADPGTLFHFLRLACERAVPKSIQALPPAFGPEFLPGISVFARRYFRDLFARFDSPVVVVFDNLETVPADSAFYEILREGAFEIPRGAHVVIGSRAEPHPALARFVAGREMTRLGWDEVRFTEEEAQALLGSLARREYDPRELARILELTQGWAAGLILLASERGAGGLEPRAAGSATGEMLFDYFATEVFRGMESARQDFLLKTAFLTKITPGSARELTGNARAEAVLDELRRRNFFTVRRPTGDVYEYHPLFRRFLRRRAGDSYAEDELAAIKRSAAASLAGSGLVDDAARLLLEVSDWDSLSRLIATQAPELVGQTRHRTLESWLEGVPEPVLEARPWLRYWLGISRTLFKPPEAEAALTRAYERFRSEQDALGVFLSWSALVGTLANAEHYTANLDRWIDEFPKLISVYRRFPSLHVECVVAVNLLAALAAKRPSHPDINYWGERAVALAEQVGDVDLQMQAHLFRFHSLLLAHTHEQRSALLAKLSNLASQPGASDFSVLRVKVTFAAHHLYRGLFERCMELVDEALAFAQQTGILAFKETLKKSDPK